MVTLYKQTPRPLIHFLVKLSFFLKSRLLKKTAYLHIDFHSNANTLLCHCLLTNGSMTYFLSNTDIEERTLCVGLSLPMRH